jgi:hypothetical protein
VETYILLHHVQTGFGVYPFFPFAFISLWEKRLMIAGDGLAAFTAEVTVMLFMTFHSITSIQHAHGQLHLTLHSLKR